MWRGDCYGGTGTTDFCVAPINISIGTHALHAAGYAMGVRFDGDDDVAVAFIGDGSISVRATYTRHSIWLPFSKHLVSFLCRTISGLSRFRPTSRTTR